MVKEEPFKGPDPRDAGVKGKEGPGAVFTWFGPVDEPQTRFRYAVIKEEEGVLSIEPGEGRFKKGLQAVRYTSEEATEGTRWLVVKTRHNRIDLVPAEGKGG